MKSDGQRRSVGVALALAAILLIAPVAVRAEEIPSGGPTDLPDYVGAPAKAYPTANSACRGTRSSPNRLELLCHLDPWMSDTADIAGPLGDNLTVSPRPSQRRAWILYPIRTTEAPPWLFQCITFMFDSHGQLAALPRTRRPPCWRTRTRLRCWIAISLGLPSNSWRCFFFCLTLLAQLAAVVGVAPEDARQHGAPREGPRSTRRSAWNRYARRP